MKYINRIVSVILIVCTLFMANKIVVDNKALDVIATFLSITVGFTITALSIIATSSFSKELYNIELANDNSKTLLHDLIDKFKNAIYMYSGTIAIIILYQFIPFGKLVNNLIIFKSSYTLDELFKALLIILTLLCFYNFLSLFNTFTKFVSKTASK